MVKDLKVGRLLADTIIAKDSSLTPEFFTGQLSLFSTVTNDSFARQLEPRHKDYWKLKEALHQFLPKANFKFLRTGVIQNRKLLRETMEKYGFRVLETEWWHYSWPNDRNYELLDLGFKKLREVSD